MIQITVKDPANTPPLQLAIAIAVLQAFQGGEQAQMDLLVQLQRGPAPAFVHLADVTRIAPDDNPAAGVETVSPEAAFADAAAASAFGSVQCPLGVGAGQGDAGNGLGGSAFASFPSPASTIAGSPLPLAAMAALAPAGDAGNAPVLGAGSPAITTPATAFTPPAPPSAPSVAGAPAAAGGVELDLDGLPWDARIHAKGDKGAKPKNADGRWRKKRGVDDALVAQVEAQLRQLMGAPTAGNGAPAGAPVTPPPAPPPPAPGAPQPPAPPAPSAPTISFADLAMRVGGATISGKVSQDEVVQLCASNGVPSFALLVSRPDLLPAISAAFDELLASKG